MLLSMTGYGEAHFQSDKLRLSIELRAVNNRYLKVTVRAPEPLNLMEPEFEKVIRGTIRRGTILVLVSCERQHAPQDFRINATALRSYLDQINHLVMDLNLSAPGSQPILAQVLALPGVAAEPGNSTFDATEEWPIFEQVLREALAKLQIMRRDEGQAMAEELLRHSRLLTDEVERIRERAPQVAGSYRERLHDRLRKLLSELDVELDRSEIIKEVAVFAERSDISEELVRLSSHLDQFAEIVAEPESPGRKLEFLTQEMFREANTIGSKASDVEISRRVVEIKGLLEKIRELVQNVE